MAEDSGKVVQEGVGRGEQVQQNSAPPDPDPLVVSPGLTQDCFILCWLNSRHRVTFRSFSITWDIPILAPLLSV